MKESVDKKRKYVKSYFSLEEIRKMDAKQLLEKRKIVVYSKKDIKEINECLKKINEICEKNLKKLNVEAA